MSETNNPPGIDYAGFPCDCPCHEPGRAIMHFMPCCVPLPAGRKPRHPKPALEKEVRHTTVGGKGVVGRIKR